MHLTQKPRRRVMVTLIAHALLTLSVACALNPGADTPPAAPVGPTATVTPLPKPSRTPAPQARQVALAADGSGDYRSLDEAVRAVPPGSTITLGPGTYRLTAALVIDTSLTLNGAGIDATEIVGSAGEAAVTVTADGFTARDLSIRYDGAGIADALRIERGQITIERCRFTGATHTTGERATAGLHVLGDATGSVASSEAVHNDLDGIRLADRARLTLTANTCSNNGQMGIQFRDESGGSATGNTCERNALSGLFVTGSAIPSLRENTTRFNTESGIAYFGNAGGDATANTASENGLHGISVNGTAAPHLQDNACTANAQNGIAYFDQSGGVALGNTCTANGLHGIGVIGDSAPELRGNQISDNVEAGMRLAERSVATVVENVCRSNGLSGFIIRDEAIAVLRGNLSEANVESGFVWFGNAGGEARDNRALRNELHGFDFYGTSFATLVGNTAQENTEVGIRVTEEATPYLFDNLSAANGLAGLIVRDAARPTIEANTLQDNVESGAAYFGTSGGLFSYNEVRGNGLNGVNVTDDATPIVERNTLLNNAESGLAYFKQSAGVTQGNTINGNKWGIYVESGANPALGTNEVINNETNIDDRRPASQPRPVVPPLTAGDPPQRRAEQPPTELALRLFDDFTAPHPGWWTGTDENGRVWMEQGELRLRNETTAVFATHTEPGLWLADVIVEVESRLVGGTDNNWIDLMCRRQSEDEHYIAGYSSDGFVRAQAQVAGETIYYVDVTQSDAILTGTGSTNRLQLDCIGCQIRLWVNGTLVAEFTDTVLRDGDVGVAVSALDGEYSEVAFDNFRVNQPE
jgi:parallel beta-helix repeat protein